MALVKIRGVEFEVPEKLKKSFDKFEIGMPVKVGNKDGYNLGSVKNGIIVDFADFDDDPTIIIAVIEEKYTGIDIDLIYYNEASSKKFVLAPSTAEDIQDARTICLQKINADIAEQKRKLGDLESKKRYVEKYFNKITEKEKQNNGKK